jgi:hypothetical protein
MIRIIIEIMMNIDERDLFPLFLWEEINNKKPESHVNCRR